MDKPIRVLQVCQRMEAAGVQTFIMNVYRNIDRSKVQFDFLVHYKEKQFYDREIEQLGGKIYKFSVREDYNIVKYCSELDSLFKKQQYSIVHGHMDTLGGIYLNYAKKNAIPVRIAHSHSEFVQSGIKKYPRLFMIKQYSKYATDLFACSESAGEFMFGDKKFRVINNAIDAEKFKYNQAIRQIKRNELGIEEGTMLLGNVGRFHVAKNQLFLLDIMTKLRSYSKKVRLIIISSRGGENETLFLKKVHELNLENSVLILKDRKDMNELYQAMDVYIMPSLFEGFPVSAIEAQAAGLPCVFSSSISHKLNICKRCIFIPLDQDPDEWAKQIINIYNGLERCDTSMIIKEKGFDIKTESKRMEKFYLNKWRDNNA